MLSHGKTGLLITPDKLFMSCTDTCRKKFAILRQAPVDGSGAVGATSILKSPVPEAGPGGEENMPPEARSAGRLREQVQLAGSTTLPTEP